MAIKLAVRTQGGWHHFTASFATEAQAIGYASARRSTHIIDELEDAPLDRDAHTKLLDYLYPTCHHGMSETMCMDPYGDNHFGSAEWERAQYGF